MYKLVDTDKMNVLSMSDDFMTLWGYIDNHYDRSVVIIDRTGDIRAGNKPGYDMTIARGTMEINAYELEKK